MSVVADRFYIALFSSSVQFFVLRKARMRSTPSLRSFPNVSFETVPVFVWLTMAPYRPFKEDSLALPLLTPLSSRRSMVWRLWLCARRQCLKFLNTSDHPRSKPLGRVTLLASLSARSFPFTPACPGQYTNIPPPSTHTHTNHTYAHTHDTGGR